MKAIIFRVFDHFANSLWQTTVYQNLLESSKLSEVPSQKNDISGYIWHRSCIKMAKYSFLDEKIVYQSFYDAPLTFSSFSSSKIPVFRHASASVCLQILVEKSYLWFYLTQIVHSNHKMLFSRSKDCLWHAALVKLFFLQGKVCVLYPCVGKSLARCLSFEAFWRPCRNNCISAYIGYKPFIQTGKYSSFNQRIVYQSFYGALLTLNYFFFKEMCYSVAKSLARCLSKEAFQTLFEKLYIPLYLTQTVHSNGKMLFF